MYFDGVSIVNSDMYGFGAAYVVPFLVQGTPIHRSGLKNQRSVKTISKRTILLDLGLMPLKVAGSGKNAPESEATFSFGLNRRVSIKGDVKLMLNGLCFCDRLMADCAGRGLPLKE